jgi:hypothetical protein
MTRHIFTKLVVLIAVAPALVQAQESKRCSNATSAGSWGFTTNGVILLPTGAVPVTAVGSFTQDLNGNLVGSQERSLGGGVAHETFTGTATTNPDCTGKFTITVYDDSGNLVRTSVLDVVFTNSSKKAHVMFESIILPNGASLPSVLTIDGDKL